MNFFTIDLEDWFHVFYAGTPVYEDWNKLDSIVENNTEIILRLLCKYNTKATFFILGWIAEKYPELIRKISDQGHEIANHGYLHRKIYDLNQQEFEKDLDYSSEMIYKACKKYPIGFRAPGFSINRSNIWALDLLSKNGYIYDSSIFTNELKSIEKFGIIEIPIQNNNIISSNFLGGILFRLTPCFVLKSIIKNTNKRGRDSVLVIHPREVSDNHLRLKLSPLNNLKTYLKTKDCLKKMDFVLQKFKWISIIEVLEAYDEL